MSEIYFLEPAVRFDDKLVYASTMEMETTLCPLNAGLPSQHAARQRWVRPLKVIGSVKRMTDFEWSVYRDILIEKDIVKELSLSGFSGVDFQPAEVYTTTETPIGRQVFELKPTGWGGMAHPNSGIRPREICPRCGSTVYTGHTNPSKLLDIDKWDGSDFFAIWPMPRFVFVTKEVAEFIHNKDYSGVNVRKLEELRKPIAGGYSPGHIEDWYDKEKAAEILQNFDY